MSATASVFCKKMVNINFILQMAMRFAYRIRFKCGDKSADPSMNFSPSHVCRKIGVVKLNIYSQLLENVPLAFLKKQAVSCTMKSFASHRGIRAAMSACSLVHVPSVSKSIPKNISNLIKPYQPNLKYLSVAVPGSIISAVLT